MQIVNLYAGPGAGKSTVAAGLFYLMKMNGYNVELVTEFARDEINNDSSAQLKSQDWLLAHQHQRIRRLRDKCDWVVTDSPILLLLAYGDEQWSDKSYLPAWKEVLIGIDAEFNNHNFFIQRPINGFTEVGRAHDLEQSIDIDTTILTALHYHKIPYTVYPANKMTANAIFDKIHDK